MISVCFRFDDPSATSDHNLEKKIFELFASFGFSLTTAVTPYWKQKSGELIEISKENIAHLVNAEQSGIIDIALHGHSHLPRGSNINGSPSEFSGTPKSQQLHLIKEASTLISSIFDRKILGFVPPWNSYDQTTANVLDELGFKYLSASWKNFKSGKLATLPRTCTMRDALSAVKESTKLQKFLPVIIIVFHPDEFEEFCFPPDPGDAPPFTNLKKLKELLDYINTHKNIEVSTIEHIACTPSYAQSAWTPHQLTLPYRFKALVPSNMLFRSNRLKVLSGMLKMALLKLLNIR